MFRTCATTVTLLAVVGTPAAGVWCQWTCAHATAQGHVHAARAAAGPTLDGERRCRGHVSSGLAIDTSTIRLDASTVVHVLPLSIGSDSSVASAFEAGLQALRLHGPPGSPRTTVLRI